MHIEAMKGEKYQTIDENLEFLNITLAFLSLDCIIKRNKNNL